LNCRTLSGCHLQGRQCHARGCWGALLDRQGKRYQERHLHLTSAAESQVLPLLEADPLLLITPLVRAGNELAIGWDEPRWRAFLKAAGAP
jgi:arsenate reductase-like glutaredoxin family protein